MKGIAAMKELLHLFKKVGGKKILHQYARAHVLPFFSLLTVILGFSRKSLEIVRLAVSNRILCKMRKNITDLLNNIKSHTTPISYVHIPISYGFAGCKAWKRHQTLYSVVIIRSLHILQIKKLYC